MQIYYGKFCVFSRLVQNINIYLQTHEGEESLHNNAYVQNNNAKYELMVCIPIQLCSPI